MQFFFWIPTVISSLLVAVLWHVYRKNRGYSRRNTEAHQALQSTKNQSNQINVDRQNEATKSKNTEEKLRTYLNLLDILINTIPCPIYFKDEDGIYRGCNKAFAERILGISRSEIIGHSSQDLVDQIPSELAAFYRSNERKMLLKGGLHSFEAKIPCQSGIQREFLFSIAAVKNDDGYGCGSVGVMLDLTEKNRAARDRLQKEKLQGVLETAGAVCHEMNQPLQTILGYTELALAAITPDNPAFSYWTRISQQIDRMAEITRKLQGITRYETMEYHGSTKIIDIHKASSI